MGDSTVLAAALDSDPRYNAALNTGSNTELVGLLNALDGQKVFKPLTRDEALDAIGDGVRTPAKAETLDLLLREGLPTATRLTEVVDLLNSPADPTNGAAATRLQAAAEKDRTYGEVLGFDRAGLSDVREAVKLIRSSYYNKYLRGEV